MRMHIVAHKCDCSRLEYEEYAEAKLIKLRRIYGSLKIIYDGLIYSVAPDKHTNLFVENNIWYGNMNQISKYWKENVIEPRKRKKNGFSITINLICQGI